MSDHLRTALADTSAENIHGIGLMLGECARAAQEDGQPEWLLFHTLRDDLDAPAVAYRRALVAATVTVDGEDPVCVDRVVAFMVGAAQRWDNPLKLSLARELGAAARLGRDEQAGFARRLGDIDGVPGDWT